MNISLNRISPLPNALFQLERDGPQQRHRIAQFELEPAQMERFNMLLARISEDHPALDRDQVASAARELIDQSPDGRVPACIRDRVRRAGAVDLMLSDPEWETRAEAALVAALAVDYLHGNAPLIPNSLPVVGWLDDAVLVETAWPSLADEVRDYLDFCRLRRIEAGLRGEQRTHFGFTREQWQDAHDAEAEWLAHCRRVGRDSYLSADAPARFRVN
ncbi:MAG TPA: YkvA family protein [Lysobacter sp.]|nr:YkvA family protein [Lysobacter sp.]